MVSDPSFPAYEELHEVKQLFDTNWNYKFDIHYDMLIKATESYFAFVPNSILFIMTHNSHLREVVKWWVNQCLRTISVLIRELTTSKFCLHHIWRGRFSEVVIYLYRTEMLLETLIYPPFDHLVRLLSWWYFIEFSFHESFKLHKSSGSKVEMRDTDTDMVIVIAYFFPLREGKWGKSHIWYKGNSDIGMTFYLVWCSIRFTLKIIYSHHTKYLTVAIV